MDYANDRSLRSRDKLSRIFIEPPDESTLTCEDSDDDMSQTKLNLDCEVVLRNGKRLKTGRKQLSPKEWSQKCPDKSAENNQKQFRGSKPFEQDSVDEIVTEKSSVICADESFKKNIKQCRERKLLKQVHTNDLKKKKMSYKFDV